VFDQQVVVAVILGLAGLWLGHSYRRNIKQQTTERLLDSYAGLWDVTGKFGSPEARGPVEDSTLLQLGVAMDAWYFQDGAGMVLPWRTRELFFAIRNNILGRRDQIKPATMAAELARRSAAAADPQYQCMIRRQLSLLRTQLKSDLAMYRNDQHVRRLRPDERELLTLCRIRRRRHRLMVLLPFTPASRVGTVCACGNCGAAR
jgi:hypothetical protein